ncbi:MAG TPA: hypothetical protein ENI51_08025 [Candidatus Atribacteria bacterium]|nr:hypothetical protein [Candidatus Atribacteria bacterium]
MVLVKEKENCTKNLEKLLINQYVQGIPKGRDRIKDIERFWLAANIDSTSIGLFSRLNSPLYLKEVVRRVKQS